MTRKAPAAPIRRDPTRAAMARIAELVAQGADAARMRRTVGEMVCALTNEIGEVALERLAEMRTELKEDLQLATEQVADLDAGKVPELKSAQRSLTALQAAHDALSAAS